MIILQSLDIDHKGHVMKHEKIQLNNIVSSPNGKLLKYGIQYYSWVKSHRKKCYYLIAKRQYEKMIRLIGCMMILLILLIVSCFYFFHAGGWFILFIMGSLFNGITCTAGFLYCKSAAEILNVLPRLPIAVADLEKDYFKVRNSSKLPFIQTPPANWKIAISNLQYIKENSAYGILNGNLKRWDLIGYAPSWTALSVCHMKPNGSCDLQLLFVGAKIPENIFLFFMHILSLKLIQNTNYSRFDT